MNDLAGLLSGTNETYLLYVAIGLALLFVGVLVFDFLRRRRRKRRYETQSGNLGRALSRPFRRVREFFEALSHLHRHRMRRKEWDHRPSSKSSRGSRRTGSDRP